MSVVIKAEHVGKKYVIRHEQADRYKTFSGAMNSWVKKITDPTQLQQTPSKEDFWALNNVSFEIKQGERVGIIGRNGAGKSTLLKVLSRIVTPTTGRIEIIGRVASLLEVGTGFHPELSGRENIFLNGSILGMSKTEIKQKFDEIVAFAEVEKFLDTPVKRYSSGMYVRLAFSVAAHLDPEILIVDEVLAVGDAAFQKKCLGKMNDATGHGRTVLFVSHNMGQIRALCTKVIILNKGTIEFNGDVEEGLRLYHKINNPVSNDFYKFEGSTKEIFITEAFLKNEKKESANIFIHNEAVYLYMNFRAKTILEDLLLSISVIDKHDRKVFSAETNISKVLSQDKKQGEAVMKIPASVLTPGDYKLNAGIHIPNMHQFDYIESACSFSIVDNGSEFSRYAGDIGCVFVKCDWNVI